MVRVICAYEYMACINTYNECDRIARHVSVLPLSICYSHFNLWLETQARAHTRRLKIPSRIHLMLDNVLFIPRVWGHGPYVRLLTIVRWQDVNTAKFEWKMRRAGARRERKTILIKDSFDRISLWCKCVCGACECEQFSSVNKHMETRKVLCVSVCLWHA